MLGIEGLSALEDPVADHDELAFGGDEGGFLRFVVRDEPRVEVPQGRGPDELTNPTGYQKYSSLANLWLQANNNTGTPPVAPPASAFTGSAVTITAAATANTITFTGSAALPANVVLQIEIQGLKRASRKPSSTG